MKITTVAPALDVTVLANAADKISEVMDDRNVGLTVVDGILVVIARRDGPGVGVRDVVGVTVEEKPRVVKVQRSLKPGITIDGPNVRRGM